MSVVLTYLAALFVVAFNDTAAQHVSSGAAKDLFDAFQNLVAVVVGFYITGKSVEKAAAARSETHQEAT